MKKWEGQFELAKQVQFCPLFLLSLKKGKCSHRERNRKHAASSHCSITFHPQRI